jgi:sugar/nucleoside kinase (ribokinase family)
MLFSRNGLFLLPAYPLGTVCDPTGAGDTFAGAFIGRLAALDRLDETALRDAMLYGTVVASFGVEAFSVERLIRLTAEDIDERVDGFRRMLQV